MITMAPHGILCCGFTANFAVDSNFLDKGYKFLMADILFYLPIVSDVMKYFGGESVSKNSLLKIMKNG